MREILFRGKRVDNSEWTYGYFVAGKYYLEDEPINAIFPTDVTFFPACETDEYEIVDPETVGQWTGLVDKNGVKIFEGDIICGDEEMCSITHCTNTGQTNTVKWTYKDLRYVAKCTPSSLMLIQSRCKKFEVIGNIWDNPEMLEDKYE